MAAVSGRVNQAGQGLPLREVLVAHLRAGDGERPRPRRHAVGLFVAVLVGQVDHLAERDHLHADLVRVARKQLLRVVRAEEGLPVRVVAGPRVVAADDEVGRAVVPPDDRVPERLARAGHAHRERQERQQRARRGRSTSPTSAL